jgi:hypothetical protein
VIARLGERRITQAWRRWKVDSAIIRAKLRAYYPHDDIAREWEQFDLALIGFYRIALGYRKDGVGMIESALNMHSFADPREVDP